MPSATITWRAGSTVTSTAATTAQLMTDLKALVDANSGDANFKWQTASSNLGSSPYYVVFKRKDASAGRILLVGYTSAPSLNPTLFASSPSTTTTFIYCAYFPSGNVDTPSNLSATSGTILGDDTGCSMASFCNAGYTVSTNKCGYLDSEAGLIFIRSTDITIGTAHIWIAGDIYVDTSDNVVPGVFSPNGSAQYYSAVISDNTWFNWGSYSWSPGSISAPHCGAYDGQLMYLYRVFNRQGTWTTQSWGSSDDPMVNTSGSNDAYFIPYPPMMPKKSGVKAKLYYLRQIALGPICTSPYQTINSSGPTAQAIAINIATTYTGTSGILWATNFKVT